MNPPHPVRFQHAREQQERIARQYPECSMQTSADRILELEDRVAELEVLLGYKGVAPWLTPNLTTPQRRLLGHLLTVPMVTRASALEAVKMDHAKEVFDESTVDVRMHHVRKFLRSRGVVIHKANGEGWWLDPSDREKLKAELFAK